MTTYDDLAVIRRIVYKHGERLHGAIASDLGHPANGIPSGIVRADAALEELIKDLQIYFYSCINGARLEGHADRAREDAGGIDVWVRLKGKSFSDLMPLLDTGKVDAVDNLSALRAAFTEEALSKERRTASGKDD